MGLGETLLLTKVLQLVDFKVFSWTSWDPMGRCETIKILDGVQGVASSNPATPTK